jgi:hypothetical protein
MAVLRGDEARYALARFRLASRRTGQSAAPTIRAEPQSVELESPPGVAEEAP